MIGKNQSITSDTRLTGSVNQSLLGKPHMARQLARSENCEVEFLRQKNGQLQETVKRMSEHIADLQKNKIQLLTLNQKYVRVVNEYYRKNKTSGKQNKNNGTNSLLTQLQRDHRNLVKHCLNMQQEIKNYTHQMKKFNQMKEHLLAVNHTNTKQLIQELRQLTDQNRAIKKENNRLSFQLEKSKQEGNRLRKGKEDWEEKADLDGGQLDRYKSLINTIQQESSDKSQAYESKIYELEIKVQKLESQMRKEQQSLFKTNDVKRKLQIEQVEHIHERDIFRLSLKDRKTKSKHIHAASFYQ